MSWIIVDTSYLLYRSQHVMGNLEYKGQPTGGIYGLLRDVYSLRSRFETDNFIFAFDSKGCLRRKLYPWYKLNRHGQHDEMRKFIRKQVHQQSDLLRQSVLRKLGYRNVFAADGFEGDDMIAMAKRAIRRSADSDAMIYLVSADQDLYQLLGKRTIMLRPNTKGEFYGIDKFKEEYPTIEPKHWPMVKAIAGCKSDNVPGIPKIGNVKAAQWYGQTGSAVAKEKIDAWIKTDQYQDNLNCCKLPFAGCPFIKVRFQDWTKEKNWKQVCKLLGIKTLEASERYDMGPLQWQKTRNKEVRRGLFNAIWTNE